MGGASVTTMEGVASADAAAGAAPTGAAGLVSLARHAAALAPPPPAAAPPVATVTSTATEPGDLPPLERVHLLPLEGSALEDGTDRLSALRGRLLGLRETATAVERGFLLRAEARVGHCSASTFAVVQCAPPRGRISAETTFWAEGPALPALRRLQLCALKRHEACDSNEALLSTYALPYLRSLAAAQSRIAVVAAGDIVDCLGVSFHVAVIDPVGEGWGVVDERTEVFACVDPADEFRRIHVVPFTDTLPSAYQFDIFTDYVKPFFASHKVDKFVLGQTFMYSGVIFKVVAVEPSDRPSRVGASTDIFTDGQLQPTMQEMLSPEQARLLSILPPGLQLLLLQTDMFGSGEVAERLVAAEAARRRGAGRQVQLSQSIVGATEECEWSEELRERQSLDQDQCIVCLADFMLCERVRILPCRHVFHVACIDEWLGRDAHCPLCRHGLRVSRGRNSWRSRLGGQY